MDVAGRRGLPGQPGPILVWWGRENGTFQSALPPPSVDGQMTVAGDLDGDGLMELVVCTFSDTLAVLRQTRARVILPPETDVAGARAEQALLAELFDRSSRTRRRGRVWTCGGFARQVQP